MLSDMSNSPYVFENVTLLITHYNRSSSLKRLLQSFAHLQMEFSEIIVSDDASTKEHLEQVKNLQDVYHFQLITSPVNKGLSNNINKGQDAVKTPYTLYIQEDFVPTKTFPIKFQQSLEIMEERKDIDLVRYWAFGIYPYLSKIRNGFSEMKFSFWKPGYIKFYVYSDACHLRRSSFFHSFGRFIEEGIKSDRAEYLMMMSFNRNKGVAIYYDNFRELFEHQNSEDEPSTVARDTWRTTVNPVIAFFRFLYRYIKFNLDYLMLFSWHVEKITKQVKKYFNTLSSH
jgi:glycosyltransferase involved in cell wall biosynthesis